MAGLAGSFALQHLIDPAICIRCNTCEETCPTGAIEHDIHNYVVKFEICNGCRACVAPCPTGAIDSWRSVAAAKAHTVEEQYRWDELPVEEPLGDLVEGEVPEEVARMTIVATSGQGSAALPPHSAAHPAINLYSISTPAIATVTGNFRLTAMDCSNDIRHLVLDFGTRPFPVLEGQSIGIIPPGTTPDGRPHYVRLYSVASPREGERPNYSNVALTVRRVSEDREGNPTHGVCSHYLCDLRKGGQGKSRRTLWRHVPDAKPCGRVADHGLHRDWIGPHASHDGTVPPQDPSQGRRRKYAVFWGSGTRAATLLWSLEAIVEGIHRHESSILRIPGSPKCYVQDLIRQRGDKVAQLLQDENSYVYICGLKGMEEGVDRAFADACSAAGLDWDDMRASMLRAGRLHIETY